MEKSYRRILKSETFVKMRRKAMDPYWAARLPDLLLKSLDFIKRRLSNEKV